MQEEPNPEVKRRELMSGGWRVFNVGAFLTLGGFLGGLSIASAISGHPSSMFCYECRRCATSCPFGWDPSGFLIAARANHPDLRMISRIKIAQYNRAIGDREPERRLTIDRLAKMDPMMKIKVHLRKGDGWGDPITVRAGDAVGVYSDDDLFEVEEMRANDAAFLCPLCGHCEPPCPVDLPVRTWIRDLKDNGKFR